MAEAQPPDPFPDPFPEADQGVPARPVQRSEPTGDGPRPPGPYGLLEGQSPVMRDLATQSLAAGLTFAVSVGLFAIAGHWLDGQWGTEPWMLLVGALLGIVGGMVHLITVVAPGVLPYRRPSRPVPPPPPSGRRDQPEP